MMQEMKRMQVAIVGNPNSGKTQFLSQIIKTKYNELKVNREFFARKIMERIYQITILEVNDKEHENKIDKHNDVVIIVFDICNNQSFMDVARNWLSFAQKVLEGKNLALLAHNVDKEAPAMSLQNIIDFANNNKLQLFFSSTKMNCKKIFDDIILWSECNSVSQALCKEFQEEPKKSQGFIDKLLGVGKPIKSEEEAIRNKVKQLYESSLFRLHALRKCLREAELRKRQQVQSNQSQMKKRLKEICKMVQAEDAKESISLEELIEILGDRLVMGKKQNNELVKRVNENALHNTELQQKIMCLEQKLKQQEQKVRNLSNGLQETKRKLSQAKSNQEKLELQIQGLKKKVESLGGELLEVKQQKQQCALSMISFDEEYAEKAEQFKKKLTNLQTQLRIKQTTRAFWEVGALRNMQAANSKQLRQMLTKSSGKEISYCQKIYQSQLCSNSNFHSYIDNNSSLLYVIQLTSVVLVIYASEALRSLKAGRQGFVVTWDRKNSLQVVDVNPAVELWRYDPLSLVFGKGELNIKFRKNKCWLCLIDRKVSLIKKRDKSLEQILQMEKRQDRTYEISCLQIFKVHGVQA